MTRSEEEFIKLLLYQVSLVRALPKSLRAPYKIRVVTLTATSYGEHPVFMSEARPPHQIVSFSISHSAY